MTTCVILGRATSRLVVPVSKTSGRISCCVTEGTRSAVHQTFTNYQKARSTGRTQWYLHDLQLETGREIPISLLDNVNGCCEAIESRGPGRPRRPT